MSDIEYRLATQEDLSQIAKTHIYCFPDYFISSLGASLIEKYYLEFIREGDLFVLALDNDEVIGFCMGYIIDESKARDNFIRNNAFALSMKLLTQCFALNKRTILKCFKYIENKLKREQTDSIQKHGGDLLSICVKGEYRGKGVSLALLNRFEDKLLEKGQNEYWLGVYKTNVGAIKFYEKMGMKIELEDEEEYKYHKHIRRNLQ